MKPAILVVDTKLKTEYLRLLRPRLAHRKTGIVLTLEEISQRYQIVKE